jgi:hypothetical protein
MYTRYAERLGLKLEVLGSDPSDMGGYNEITFLVKGEGVWTRMKFEGGVHRVQRVPATESQGRIHTSSATVTVLPEAEEVDLEIDPNDLKIDVYRSCGAYHPPSYGRSGVDAGREEPDPEPRQGAGGLARTVVEARAGQADGRPVRAAARPGRHR